MISCIVGEGGSGGAVALAAADRVLMFEHAVYAVISPEGCASILWRTNDRAADAAQAMKVTAADLKSLGVIDSIVPEPMGGAHRDHSQASANLGKALIEALAAHDGLSRGEIKRRRHSKFLKMGQF
jgi:acetyl-CoA carboxylase carboxyl transferase subunit alpha